MKKGFVLAAIVLGFMLSGCAEQIDERARSVFDVPLSPGGKNLMRAQFSQIQDSVLTPTCAQSGCHNGTQTPNMTAGVAYNNIVNRPALQSGLDYIEPGDPQQSYLYRKITGTGMGARMPFEEAPLSQAKIDSIRKWIEDGAPDN